MFLDIKNGYITVPFIETKKFWKAVIQKWQCI